MFVMSPRASPHFTIFSSHPLKKMKKKSLYRTYALLIQYLYTDEKKAIHSVVPKNAILNSFSYDYF